MNATTSSSAAPRGTKRKRPDPPAEDPTKKLAGKLHHEVREVRKAAKKARTFETQRVVKKLKGLRKKDPAAREVAVLEAELEVLKTTDSDAIADTAFRTRLLKDRHITDSAPARAVIEREIPPSAAPSLQPTNSNSKVHARLLSARALGAAVTQAVAGLRAVLLPPADAAAGVGAAVADVDMEEDGDEDADEEEDDGEDEDRDEDEDQEDESAAENDERQGEDAAGWESGSVDGDEDGWESGSVHSDAPPPAKKAAKPAAKPTPAKPSTKAAASTSTSTSQFLPSLAVGFIRGGSSESDVDENAGEEGGERKNRRGQRARRAIWEKKYGRGANHKKKEAEETAKERAEQKAQWEVRQAKRDAQAQNANGRGKGKAKWTEGAQVVDGGWGARGASAGKPQTQATVQGQAKPHAPARTHAKADKDVGLHPSWAAKKALKEKMGSGIVPSQGKKIVFS